jgi:ATP-dependent DNA helicase RecG
MLAPANKKMKLDTPTTRGYAVGFQGLVAFIVSPIPSNEVIEQPVRRDMKILK